MVAAVKVDVRIIVATNRTFTQEFPDAFERIPLPTRSGCVEHPRSVSEQGTALLIDRLLQQVNREAARSLATRKETFGGRSESSASWVAR